MEPKGSLPCSPEPVTCSYSEPDESSQHPPILYLLRSILTLLPHLCLSLSGGLFLSGSPTNTFYTFLFSPMHATFPTHFILLDLIILIISVCREVQIMKTLVCSCLQILVASSLLGKNIFISNLFSNTLTEKKMCTEMLASFYVMHSSRRTQKGII
jgi:hypothetical protein